MIINILYVLYFGGIDFLLYLLLSKKLNINGKILLACGLFVVLVVCLHMGFVPSKLLMASDRFADIFFFSIGLAILHIGTTVQLVYFERQAGKLGLTERPMYKGLITTYDFIRLELIYPMTFIYQFLAICNKV